MYVIGVYVILTLVIGGYLTYLLSGFDIASTDNSDYQSFGIICCFAFIPIGICVSMDIVFMCFNW